MRDHSVLIVDDDADILGIVREILSVEGYSVQTAVNGMEALEKIRAQRPGLVLLDMRMPVMDGWQFAKRLRAHYKSSIPIIVMTAARDARQRANEVHAEDYLPKPFDIDDLIEKVRQHVDQ